MGDRSSRGSGVLVEERPALALEQLDATLRIVGFGGWLALAGVFLTLAAIVVLSCFYQVPLKIDGRGIILAKLAAGEDSLQQVTAPAAGRLSQVSVKIGTDVQVGDLLALIDSSELRDRLMENEAELERLHQEDAMLGRFEETESASKREAIQKVESTLTRNLDLDLGRLGSYRKIAAVDQGLNLRRLLSDGDALKSRAEADDLENAIGGTQAKLHELAFTRVEDGIARRREKLKRALAIQAAEMRRGLLVDQFERESRILSTHAGRVVDLMLTEYALVEKGAPTVLLRPQSQDNSPLEAVAFVSAGPGKRIRVGDTVEISPDTTRRPEHGFIWGVVHSISEIPSTEQAMLAELKHKPLVASFVEQHRDKVVLSIHISLREADRAPEPVDEEPKNRLAWSSSAGTREPVTIGTLCAASIVVERRPLITLALPWVKQLVGLN